MTRVCEEGDTEHVYYMPEMLDYLWRETGLVFVAVCSGGAALSKPHGRGASYEQLLSKVPHGLDMIVAVICGNDLLASGLKVVEYCPEWEVAAAALCRGLKEKSPNPFAVVGGSSTCWGYASWMTGLQQSLYDANASRLCAYFESLGVRRCTGADELRSLQISDLSTLFATCVISSLDNIICLLCGSVMGFRVLPRLA